METKTCNKCGNTKPVSGFRHTVKAGKPYIRPSCVVCTREHEKQLRAKNKEKKAEANKKWYEANKEYYRNHSAKWRAENRERHNEKARRFYAKDLDESRRRSREHARRYREEHPEAFKERWRKASPHKRAARLKRTPAWVDRVAVDYVYHAAQVIKDVYGTTWHVDHIIPLQGENVSGLHVANNLQLLSPEANLSKSNKFEVC